VDAILRTIYQTSATLAALSPVDESFSHPSVLTHALLSIGNNLTVRLEGHILLIDVHEALLDPVFLHHSVDRRVP